MRKIKVAIPLKTNSSRVPLKNIRKFVGDQSLFDIKAQQLLKVFSPDDVYVTCENPEVRPLVEKYGFHFHLRDISLTYNSAPAKDLLQDSLRSIPADCDVMWAQVTQPLFNEFDKMLATWKKVHEKHDSMAVVQKIAHHLMTASGHPLNFNFGPWHKNSQDLDTYYQLTWAAYIMKREMLERCWYYIGKTPYLYATEAPLVDVDTEQDFAVAGILYNHYLGGNAQPVAGTVSIDRTTTQASKSAQGVAVQRS